jgi:hypothetical protein
MGASMDKKSGQFEPAGVGKLFEMHFSQLTE